MVRCVDSTFEDGNERQLNVFQGVSSILGDLPSFLSDSLFFLSEGVCWGFEKGSHVWRIRPLTSGEEGILFPGHDVARVSIHGMVIVFDALGAINDLGTKVPETAEAWSSLYFIDRPYCCPYVFCTLFHHAHFLHGICVIRPLESLFITTIYRSGVFGHFTPARSPRFTGAVSLPYVQGKLLLTAIYRCGVFSFRIFKHDC